MTGALDDVDDAIRAAVADEDVVNYRELMLEKQEILAGMGDAFA